MVSLLISGADEAVRTALSPVGERFVSASMRGEVGAAGEAGESGSRRCHSVIRSVISTPAFAPSVYDACSRRSQLSCHANAFGSSPSLQRGDHPPILRRTRESKRDPRGGTNTTSALIVPSRVSLTEHNVIWPAAVHLRVRDCGIDVARCIVYLF
ncbi:protein of unknown function [Pararobbsia alpina]